MEDKRLEKLIELRDSKQRDLDKLNANESKKDKAQEIENLENDLQVMKEDIDKIQKNNQEIERREAKLVVDEENVAKWEKQRQEKLKNSQNTTRGNRKSGDSKNAANDLQNKINSKKGTINESKKKIAQLTEEKNSIFDKYNLKEIEVEEEIENNELAIEDNINRPTNQEPNKATKQKETATRNISTMSKEEIEKDLEREKGRMEDRILAYEGYLNAEPSDKQSSEYKVWEGQVRLLKGRIDSMNEKIAQYEEQLRMSAERLQDAKHTVASEQMAYEESYRQNVLDKIEVLKKERDAIGVNQKAEVEVGEESNKRTKNEQLNKNSSLQSQLEKINSEIEEAKINNNSSRLEQLEVLKQAMENVIVAEDELYEASYNEERYDAEEIAQKDKEHTDSLKTLEDIKQAIENVTKAEDELYEASYNEDRYDAEEIAIKDKQHTEALKRLEELKKGLKKEKPTGLEQENIKQQFKLSVREALKNPKQNNEKLVSEEKQEIEDKEEIDSKPENKNVVKFAKLEEQSQEEEVVALAKPNRFTKAWNKVKEIAKNIKGFVTNIANRIFKGKKGQTNITTTPKEKIGKNNFKDELKLDYNQMEQETTKQYDHAMSEIRKDFSDAKAQGTLKDYKRILAQKTTTDLQFDYNIDYTAAAKIYASDRLNEWRQGFRQESINELFELPVGADGKTSDYTIRPDTNLKPEKIEDLSKLSIEDIQKNYFLTKAEARGIFENENVKAKRAENKVKTKEDEENQK